MKKHILVTGGTSALGESLCKLFLNNDLDVTLTYCHNKKKADELQSLGAQIYQADFRSSSEVDSFIRSFQSEHDTLHALINNAALVEDYTLKNLSLQNWEDVLQVNLKTPIQLTMGLAPLLQKKEWSKVINIISRVGVRGGFGQANYAASKDGLIEFTQYAAHLFADSKMVVLGVNPGFMYSEMTRVLPELVIEKNKKQSLFRSYSDPDEVAKFIFYLLSENVHLTTGKIYDYDARC